MVTVEQPMAGGDQVMLAFEPITMAPISRDLIDRSLLSDAEIDWIDNYHADVLRLLSPLLASEDIAWLANETRPLRDSAAGRACQLADAPH